MRRALDLALLGKGNVSPNPMVGCVIVYNDQIIGEGWHKQYGGPHAEVNAVESVKDRSLLKHATVYVTLEPCSHFGKTPPCADMLIQHHVKKVVIAAVDPNPLVSGKGIEKLVNANIEVETGLLKDDARQLNKRFFTFIEKQRPYISLKWAETSDGFIARTNRDSKWISNEYSRQLVHQWRSEEDAVLVGTGTAEHDDPKLNVRDWVGRDPVRIVSDRYLRLSTSLKLFDRSQKTICYNLSKNEISENLIYVKLNAENYWSQMLTNLFEKKIQSVIIEGGAETLSEFIKSNNWDEARIFRSPQVFNTGIPSPKLNGRVVVEQDVFNDRLTILENR